MQALTWRAGAVHARLDDRMHCRRAGAAKERTASIVDMQ